MTEIPLNGEERSALGRLRVHVSVLCEKNALEVGLVEMAVGASIISLGVNTGGIRLGLDIVGTASSQFGLDAKVGAVSATLGAIGAGLPGSIRVATGGAAIGIPAAIVATGAAELAAPKAVRHFAELMFTT